MKKARNWLIAFGRLAVLAMIVILGAPIAAGASSSAPWPTSPIRIICPYAPGAFTDVLARLLARELSEQLGQPVLVENRTGAGGVIGVDAVAKAQPDGHTLLITENSFAIAPSTNPNLPYDPVKDLKPVSVLANLPSIWLAQPQLAAKTVAEVVELAKSKPGALNYGSSGLGSTSHLAMEMFQKITNISMVHVPFRGAGASMPELIAGRIDLVLVTIPTALSYVKAGSVRALAVTGPARDPILPEVPTFAESGFPAFDVTYWFGLFAPAKTPAGVVTRLEQEVARAMQTPRLAEAYAAQGVRPVWNSSNEFTAFVHDQIGLWQKVVKETGVKLE